ncbi:MAG: hypothetical protein KAI84_21525, partial [Gammaproteobacteria bacterium]|nr:hypothetical protein [Gammaproteobacteria bacterium]
KFKVRISVGAYQNSPLQGCFDLRESQSDSLHPEPNQSILVRFLSRLRFEGKEKAEKLSSRLDNL